MARQAASITPRATKRAAHDHCEWANDSHLHYCREAGSHVFRHPRGMLGILFVCDAHALDALAEGKPLPVFGRRDGGEGSR